MARRFSNWLRHSITRYDESRKGDVVDYDDVGLVRAALERVVDLANAPAARELGVSEATVRRWRAGSISTPLRTTTRLALRQYLAGGAPQSVMREAPPRSTYGATDLPDASFLKPRARAFYDRTVGSWLTRGWSPRAVSWGAHSLINQLRGASTLRRSGPGDADLTEDQQLIVLEGAAKWVEEDYGES